MLLCRQTESRVSNTFHVSPLTPTIARSQDKLTFSAVAGTLSAAAVGASATSSSAARHDEDGFIGVLVVEFGGRSCSGRLQEERVVEGQCGALYHEFDSRVPHCARARAKQTA